MEAVYERCCGVDVHKKILYITFCRVAGAFVRPFLVACAIIFMTMTGGLPFLSLRAACAVAISCRNERYRPISFRNWLRLYSIEWYFEYTLLICKKVLYKLMILCYY